MDIQSWKFEACIPLVSSIYQERITYLYQCLGCEITLENKEINKVIEEDALKNVCENIIVK